MNLRFLIPVVLVLSSIALSQRNQGTAPGNGGDFSSNLSAEKVPSGVILVKGAWSSATDSTTPVPEDGSMLHNVYTNNYFGMSYDLPPDWTEEYKGPPPSDSGRYVLAQLSPSETFKGPSRGIVLITAQDLFFNPEPNANAVDLVKYSRDHLQADYKVEIPPAPTKVADHPFTFFAYWSPVAQLHWYVLATEIRCHAVEIVMSSQDTKLLERLVVDLDKMKLPAEANPTSGTGGGQFPFCVKDYATDDHVFTRVEPVFAQHHFNPVPVRIIIDKAGAVKHIHFLSAFPDQAKAITDALHQWKFKPYVRDGKPAEVETGILFGPSPFPAIRKASSSSVE
jgi:hypothetical protein